MCLSNHEDPNNENIKKSKRTTLHLQHTFWFICLASLNNRQVKYFNVKVNTEQRILPLLSRLRYDP